MLRRLNTPGYRLRSTPRQRVDSAVLELLEEDWDKAIDNIEQALAEDPDESFFIDASAAYLERCIRRDRPLDCLAALRYAEMAVQKNPASEEALFNLGQALHHLHLRHLEARVWQKYMHLDSQSGWTKEACSYLEQSKDESFRLGREHARRKLLFGTNFEKKWLTSILALYPQDINELTLEELLGRWVTTYKDGHIAEAERQLRRIELIAQQLATHKRDNLASDSLQAIKTVLSKKNRADLDLFLSAHEMLQRGMQYYREQDFKNAEALLLQAAEKLRREGSPLGHYALFYHTVCVYYRDTSQAKAIFQSILATIPRERYPSLTGHILWMLGTIDFVQGRFERAIETLNTMRHYLERAAGANQIAAADLLLAEAHELRGNVEKGWDYRIKALRVLTVQGTLRRRHSVLFEASQALERRGQEDLALIFLDEVLENAKLWRQPLAKAEAFTLRSRVNLDLGDSTSALNDAYQALAAVNQMKSSSLKARTHGSALVSQGMARLMQQPLAAIQDLQQGYSLQIAGDWGVERILYLNYMARAHLALGRRREARNFLDAAVHTYEAYRSDALDTVSRIKIFQHAQQSFNDLMHLSWMDTDNGLRDSFAYSERARARYLLDSWSLRDPGYQGTLADSDEVARKLPANVIFIQFSALPEELLVWVFEDGGLRGSRHLLAASKLRSQVQNFKQALSQHDPERARALGAQLYDTLIRPLSLSITPGKRIVIAPDESLGSIPFSTLYDNLDNSYFIEKAPITIMPSATLLLAALQNSKKYFSGLEKRSMLAVAPDISSSMYPTLTRLPVAKREALQVASLYSQSEVLLGQQATVKAFMSSFPGRRVVHFSGHAIKMDASPGGSFLLLAPMHVGDRGELSIQDLQAASLANTEIIVLAACDSMNGYSQGREGALSIASSFFAAGVPNVVAALWKVDDSFSLEFMDEFHRQIAAGVKAPDALRDVMTSFIHGDTLQWRSPSLWGVFSVLGV